MFHSMLSAAVYGLDIIPVRVEADVSDGLPQFIMVGYLSAQVREADDRVHTAFRNSDIQLPPKRITINLSPADIPKNGTRFDLPIALAILAAAGRIDHCALEQTMAVGELSLDGRINPVTGVLPIAIKAAELGIRTLLVPRDNVSEGNCVNGISVIGISTLSEAISLFTYGLLPPSENSSIIVPSVPSQIDQLPDLSEIRGQEASIRASMIAAAGFHNLLLIGPPGSGKSMLARRIPTILPLPTESEQLEIARIYSIAGLIDHEHPLSGTRPFRDPHHTISPQALAGGGRIPSPGEITLAHRGILFLDEFPEFQRSTLEILRQPLEDHEIVISRSAGTFRFPAGFLLLAAMNPCPCGYYPDMNRCTCTPAEITSYVNRISKPLLDRIDLCIECPQISYEDLRSNTRTAISSSEARELVEKTRRIQEARFAGTLIRFNSEIPASSIERFCPLTISADQCLEQAYRKLELSARSYHRIIKTARTIADLDGSDLIRDDHIKEALVYRMIDRKYWRL